MVHSRGFEPLTTRFVVVYSIQLSYECIAINCEPKVLPTLKNKIKDSHQPIA